MPLSISVVIDSCSVIFTFKNVGLADDLTSCPMSDEILVPPMMMLLLEIDMVLLVSVSVVSRPTINALVFGNVNTRLDVSPLESIVVVIPVDVFHDNRPLLSANKRRFSGTGSVAGDDVW